jgi:hypothetical protein
MITRIYGASDDLIEIDGAINEEIDCYSTAEKGLKITCSDGTTGKISYDGEWKIKLKHTGDKFLAHAFVPAFGEHSDEAKGCTTYSDVLVLENIEWVKIGRKTFTVEPPQTPTYNE